MKKKFIALIVTTILFCLTAQVWAAPTAPLLSYETDGLNLTISWTEVPGATGYTLHYAEYPYSPGDPINSLDRGGATSFSIDLWVGAAYYIAVTAYDASNEESIYSNIEQFTMEEPTPEVPVLSYETDGLSITVSWTDVPDAAGYNLYFAPYPITGPDTFSHIDVDNQKSLSFYLWEDAAYYLSVKAYDGSGVEGESSNTELFIMGPPTPEWVDDDEDTFSEYDGDCDDTNFSINPGAEEICGDGIDQDCSGSDLTCSDENIDDDNDGFTENEGDCDDSEATVNPDAEDICDDNIDQDCNGQDEVCTVDANDVDDDQDGFTENQGDCDDSQASINPDTEEICEDGVDQNCDGTDQACSPDPAEDVFAYIQWRTFEDSTRDRTQGWISLPSNITFNDVQDIKLLNSSGNTVVGNSSFNASSSENMLFYDCYSGACSGSVSSDYGYWVILTDILSGSYKYVITTNNGIIQRDVTYEGEIVMPVISSDSILTEWDPDGSLSIDWVSPTNDPNWSRVGQIRIVIGTATNPEKVVVKLPANVSSMTIPKDELDRVFTSEAEKDLINVKMQTRKYTNNENTARGLSDTIELLRN